RLAQRRPPRDVVRHVRRPMMPAYTEPPRRIRTLIPTVSTRRHPHPCTSRGRTAAIRTEGRDEAAGAGAGEVPPNHAREGEAHLRRRYGWSSSSLPCRFPPVSRTRG